jgi:hypothetical protein
MVMFHSVELQEYTGGYVGYILHDVEHMAYYMI